MRKRIVSTVALWAVLFLAIYYGKIFGFFALILLLSVFSLMEMCSLMRRCGLKPITWFAQLGGIAIVCAPMAASMAHCNVHAIGSATLGILMFALGLCCLKRPFDSFIEKAVVPTFLALALVPFMLQWLVVIAIKFSYTEYSGVIIALWAIAAAKFTDVGGYAIGSAFGRHALAPEISPNKSWEGFFGGILSSMAVSVVFVWGFGRMLPDNFTVWTAALASVPIGAAGLFSDLLESVLKRRAAQKDSGALIPGIGGALDLSDSMLLSSPVAYIILTAIL